MSGLTATMVACIYVAEKVGGELVRYQGGYWAPRGSNPLVTGVPSFGTSTVEGIVRRGEAEYSEWRDGRAGRFPIAVRLVQP